MLLAAVAVPLDVRVAVDVRRARSAEDVVFGLAAAAVDDELDDVLDDNEDDLEDDVDKLLVAPPRIDVRSINAVDEVLVIVADVACVVFAGVVVA